MAARTTRWMSTLASLYIMIASCGSLNTFSLFSQYMRDSLGYDQESINSVSFFKEMGTSLGIISGLLYNISGARFVLFLSSLLNFLGYFCTWLCLIDWIPAPPVWQVCFFMCLIGASAAFTITAVLVPCAQNFPRNQGTILSILDSTNGLAGGIFTLLYEAFFITSAGNDGGSFVLMLGWFPSLIMLVLLFLVKEVPVPTKPRAFSNDLRNMHLLIFFTVFLAVYLMLVSLLLDHVVHPSPVVVKLLFGVMLVILLLPVPIILSSEHLSNKAAAEDESEALEDALIENGDEIRAPEVQELDEKVKSLKGCEDFTIREAFSSLEMWLIIGATTCGVGAALTINNNLGQIGLAVGYTEAQTNTFVALLSLCDFLGGVTTGAVSDHVLQRFGTPRPVFFLLMLAILALGNVATGIAFPGALFLGSVLVGVSLGGQWAVLFTIIAEIFGLQNYAVLQNIPTIAKGLGMYFLSVQLAGVLYDREAKRDASTVCTGAHCFRNTFMVMAGVCLVGCLMTAVLIVRTRRFYKLLGQAQQHHGT